MALTLVMNMKFGFMQFCKIKNWICNEAKQFIIGKQPLEIAEHVLLGIITSSNHNISTKTIGGVSKIFKTIILSNQVTYI
jgi:hypothetical protein